jgi:hypothetical protein
MRRIKKASPGEGGQERAEQFGYTRTSPGLKGVWYGWCAHEPYWVRVHEHRDSPPSERGTKVCLTWATDNALRCPRCRPGVVPTTVAYVPVWREQDLAPCMVICHESAGDRLAGVEYGVYVMVSCVEVNGGVCVSRAATQRPWTSTLPYRQGPCDIAVSLLTMWQYPQYTEWLQRPASVQCEPVPETQAWRLSVPPPTTPTETQAVDAHRRSGADGGADVNAAMQRALRRARAAEKNGKHPPTEGE